MKFEDAYNQVFDKNDKESQETIGIPFAMTDKTLKVLAFIWNMLAVARFMLDDTVRISNNNKIISTPLSVEKKEKTTKDKPDSPDIEKVEKTKRGPKSKKDKEWQTSSIDKTAGQEIEDEDGKEEPKETATE